jgi:hypothetical protein
MTKKEIEQKFSISAWSVLLIELDQPELGVSHRAAVIAQQRDKHRNALQSFLINSPDASRTGFVTDHSGAYDWLWKFDRDWLDDHLPKRLAIAPQKNRKARKQWHLLNQAAISIIQNTAQTELSKSERPIRLTRTRLLASANAKSAMGRDTKHRYSTAMAEATCLAESREQFIRRTVRWALKKYAEEHIPISTNKLRRVASLPARQLIEHRLYVIEIAAELGLVFDARCVLAPWHQ